MRQANRTDWKNYNYQPLIPLLTIVTHSEGNNPIVDNGETDEVIESLKAVLVIFVPLPEFPHDS